jgi:hypothetical protein
MQKNNHEYAVTLIIISIGSRFLHTVMNDCSRRLKQRNESSGKK